MTGSFNWWLKGRTLCAGLSSVIGCTHGEEVIRSVHNAHQYTMRRAHLLYTRGAASGEAVALVVEASRLEAAVEVSWAPQPPG